MNWLFYFQLDEFDKLDYSTRLKDLNNQVQLKEQQLGKTHFQLQRFFWLTKKRKMSQLFHLLFKILLKNLNSKETFNKGFLNHIENVPAKAI